MKTVAINGDSIITNIPRRSLSNSLDECFSIIKSIPGATAKGMRDYIKPSMARNKTPSDTASEIIKLAKSIKTNGIEVAVSSLIHRLKKVKKVNIHLQEK